MTQAFNVDCLEYMKGLPDKAFDLAVVDPPYGDALDTHTHTHTAEPGTASEGGLTGTRAVGRAGGQWAEKYGKKS